MLRLPTVMLRAVAASRKRQQNSLSSELLDSTTNARNDEAEDSKPLGFLPTVMLPLPTVMLRAVAASRKQQQNSLSSELLDSATNARNDEVEV